MQEKIEFNHEGETKNYQKFKGEFGIIIGTLYIRKELLPTVPSKITVTVESE